MEPLIVQLGYISRRLAPVAGIELSRLGKNNLKCDYPKRAQAYVCHPMDIRLFLISGETHILGFRVKDRRLRIIGDLVLQIGSCKNGSRDVKLVSVKQCCIARLYDDLDHAKIFVFESLMMMWLKADGDNLVRGLGDGRNKSDKGANAAAAQELTSAERPIRSEFHEFCLRLPAVPLRLSRRG
ncbi:MAG: hypothetical protein JOZ17_09985 [Acetobacteraceae bacterium]|nr:hypothetical protein [Acetobacteraceae bacterium]